MMTMVTTVNIYQAWRPKHAVDFSINWSVDWVTFDFSHFQSHKIMQLLNFHYITCTRTCNFRSSIVGLYKHCIGLMGHKYWIYADKKQEARCQKDDDM